MIKYNPTSKTWSASTHGRNPVTGAPTSLRRDKLSTEKEAMRVKLELMSALENRFKVQLQPKWPKALEEYASEMMNRDIGEKTKQTYISCLRSAVGTDWDEKFISDIKPEDIKYITKFKRPDFSESHRKSLRKFFNSFFEYMLVRGYVASNPTPKMKFSIGQKIETTLNYSQCISFLNLAKEQEHEFYPIWFLALNTGMRNGELLALKWNCVDLEKRQIKVAGTLHPQYGYKDYTKTGDDRIAPMNEQLANFLQSYEDDPSPDDHVLPRLKQWWSGEQAKVLGKFLKDNGLPVMRFHDLRATCSTLLLSKGVPLAVVMKMLGWKQLKTANLYFRKSGVDVVGATNCLTF